MTISGSIWYKRFLKDCKRLSPHIVFRPIKYGFTRIYWTGGCEPAYMHEVYNFMPSKGYDIEEKDPRFTSHKYYQEYEDQAELTLKIKNFVEGYWDSMHTMRKRVYMMKNNKEFYKTAVDAYKRVRVK